MNFDPSRFVDALPRVSEAALNNLWLASVSLCLALAGGALLTVIRAQKIRPLNAAINVFISFIRGTPLLIQIFLCYYGLPSLGLELSAVGAGILALSLNSCVFMSEILRAGLPEIDAGQVEAGTALGLGPVLIWRKILLPQLLRRSLPMLINEGTVVVKGTALLSVITVVDALRVAQQIGAATFRPFEPILAAALVFLLLNLALTLAGAAAERRFAVGRA